MNEYNINPNSVEPGLRGFLSKSDVKEYITKKNLTASPPSVVSFTQSISAESPKKTSNANVNPEYEPDFEDIELTNMRKVIAKRLVLSKTTIPHSYITTDAV